MLGRGVGVPPARRLPAEPGPVAVGAAAHGDLVASRFVAIGPLKGELRWPIVTEVPSSRTPCHGRVPWEAA